MVLSRPVSVPAVRANCILRRPAVGSQIGFCQRTGAPSKKFLHGSQTSARPLDIARAAAPTSSGWRRGQIFQIELVLGAASGLLHLAKPMQRGKAPSLTYD